MGVPHGPWSRGQTSLQDVGRADDGRTRERAGRGEGRGREETGEKEKVRQRE